MAFRSVRSAFGGFARADENATAAVAGAKQFAATGSKRSALGEIGNGNKKATSRTGKPVRAASSAPAPMEEDHVVPTTLAPAPVPAGVEDIDLVDADDPQLVATYAPEIHSYMHRLERAQTVAALYLKLTQKDITENMRSILLDWLVEVHLRFKLLQETLYLTVNILDRFLAVVPITRSKLQLVGVTAMLLASKYEEMYPPEVRDFIWIADNAYTRQEIIAMEQLMLNKLDYNLGCPLPLHFLRRYSKASNAEAEVHALSKYLMELSLGSYQMCGAVPSEVAAAAIHISRQVLVPHQPAWNATLEHYSTYSEEDISGVVATMTSHIVASTSAKQQAVRRKYASSKMMKSSELPQLAAWINSQ